MLPVGCHSSVEPDESCRCDLLSCRVENTEEPWEVFEGCGHSFHTICLQEEGFCPLCQQFLSQKVQELGNVARHATLHPQDENVEAIFPDENDSDKDDEESCNNTPDSNTGLSVSQSNLEELKQIIKSLNSTISSWVKQNHHCYTIDKQQWQIETSCQK